MKLPQTLPPPEIPKKLAQNVQWLAGEGAGSWFEITEIHAGFQISRYSPIGKQECSGVFTADQPFDLDKEWTMAYPSHCSKVNVLQFGRLISFKLEQG